MEYLVRTRSVARLAAALLAATSLGCVNLEKRDVENARAALDTCEAEHGHDSAECEQIENRLLDAQRRYDEKARKAWSCDPTQDLCPTPR